MTAEPGFDIARMWAAWHRRKWLAIVAFVLSVTLVISFLVFLPRIYRATATVLVEGQSVPEEFVRPTVTTTLETRLQTISQDILSRQRLEALIKRFNLYAESRARYTMEELLERTRADIKVEIKSTDLHRRDTPIAFTVTYRGKDPVTVVDVTNALTSTYIEENTKVRSRQATETAGFLKTQLEDVRMRLEEQEKRLGEFRSRHLGALPQQMDGNLATLERLNLQLRLNGDAQARAHTRRESLMAELGLVMPSEAGKAPEVGSMKLARLRQELQEIRLRYTAKHPDVIRLDGEIKQVEAELATKRAHGQKPADAELITSADPQSRRIRQSLAEAEAEIASLKKEAAYLRDAIGTYQRRVESTPHNEGQYQELSRDYDSTKQLYATLLKRSEDAQLAETMESKLQGEQFRIIDPAMVARPVSLRFFLLAGLVLSVGVTVVTVVLAESLDRSFHAIDDVRQFTRVPIFANICRIVTESDVDRARQRVRFAAALVTVAVVIIVVGSFGLAHNNERLARVLTVGRQ